MELTGPFICTLVWTQNSTCSTSSDVGTSVLHIPVIHTKKNLKNLTFNTFIKSCPTGLIHKVQRETISSNPSVTTPQALHSLFCTEQAATFLHCPCQIVQSKCANPRPLPHPDSRSGENWEALLTDHWSPSPDLAGEPDVYTRTATSIPQQKQNKKVLGVPV